MDSTLTVHLAREKICLESLFYIYTYIYIHRDLRFVAICCDLRFVAMYPITYWLWYQPLSLFPLKIVSHLGEVYQIWVTAAVVFASKFHGDLMVVGPQPPGNAHQIIYIYIYP